MQGGPHFAFETAPLLAAEPDLIILHLMMPRIDGAEVPRHVREDPQTRGVPVTLFSAVGYSQVHAQLNFGQIEGGVNGLLAASAS